MKEINTLLNYCLQKKIICKRDVSYYQNQLLYLLKIEEGYNFYLEETEEHISDILRSITNKYTLLNTEHEKDLFESKLIGTLMPIPSIVESQFYHLFQTSKEEAIQYFYQLSKDVNYIKEKRIIKNIEYKTPSKYGDIHITINLSKPEKTVEEIKKLKEQKIKNWPRCPLCLENEGLYGSLKNADRSNHRVINMKLNKGSWALQYSPYSYYKEHSIVLSQDHTSMKITKETFKNLIDFVDSIPFYFIGSNADLPIVGGSLLVHEHYQAGKYEFPLFQTEVIYEVQKGDVVLQILNWPMSVIKLSSKNKEHLINTSSSILNAWKNYSNKQLNIINKTTDEHNTITPIIKKNKDKYEAYLILRNNRVNKEYPDGIFHVHEDKHNIKRENIGLIEAMGLAILPARLKEELEEIEKIIANNEQLPEELYKHREIYEKFENDKQDDLMKKLQLYVGEVFIKGLEDCSVFKDNIQEFKNFLETF